MSQTLKVDGNTFDEAKTKAYIASTYGVYEGDVSLSGHVRAQSLKIVTVTIMVPAGEVSALKQKMGSVDATDLSEGTGCTITDASGAMDVAAPPPPRSQHSYDDDSNEGERWLVGICVTENDNVAFSKCSAIREVTISNSVTSIRNVRAGWSFSGTFQECKSLTSVTIPDSVTSIEKVSSPRAHSAAPRHTGSDALAPRSAAHARAATRRPPSKSARASQM